MVRIIIFSEIVVVSSFVINISLLSNRNKLQAN